MFCSILIKRIPKRLKLFTSHADIKLQTYVYDRLLLAIPNSTSIVWTKSNFFCCIRYYFTLNSLLELLSMKSMVWVLYLLFFHSKYIFQYIHIKVKIYLHTTKNYSGSHTKSTLLGQHFCTVLLNMKLERQCETCVVAAINFAL